MDQITVEFHVIPMHYRAFIAYYAELCTEKAKGTKVIEGNIPIDNEIARVEKMMSDIAILKSRLPKNEENENNG